MGTGTWVEYYKCSRRTYRTGIDNLPASTNCPLVELTSTLGSYTLLRIAHHSLPPYACTVITIRPRWNEDALRLSSKIPQSPHAESLSAQTSDKCQVKSLRVRSKKRGQNAPAEWGIWRIGTQPTHPIRVPMLPKYPQIRGQQTALPDSLARTSNKTCESGRSILSPSLAGTYIESLSSSHVDDNPRPAMKGFTDNYYP
jgi:hypothetical protein